MRAVLPANANCRRRAEQASKQARKCCRLETEEEEEEEVEIKKQEQKEKGMKSSEKEARLKQSRTRAERWPVHSHSGACPGGAGGRAVTGDHARSPDGKQVVMTDKRLVAMAIGIANGMNFLHAHNVWWVVRAPHLGGTMLLCLLLSGHSAPLPAALGAQRSSACCPMRPPQS